MSPNGLVEPSRPTAAEVEAELAEHVRTLAGPDATPRPEQLAAVTAVVAERRRTLLVARTGFGKSAVYFSATRMLRDRGWGPTIVVSPLLALMRDQVAAATRLGLAAFTINSSNLNDWDEIEDRIAQDQVDLLLIAPERLAKPGFRERVFGLMLSRPFALVCDEAHCISDWGHDFRPDYLRLRSVIDELPAWAPVLATTATANQRVTDDVASQLGADTLALRTTLDRESLYCSVVELGSDAERLAWLADNLDGLPGSGIIYTLTVDQATATAEWLVSQGHRVAAYSGSAAPEDREQLEDRLRRNDLKALVATSALGMGYDKPDLAFCVHLGLPPTPVAYYQQIGRAGRAIDRAVVVALPRPVEDERIWRWFDSVSLPSEAICNEVLAQLSESSAMSLTRLEANVNMGRSRLTTLLSILDVQGAIRKVKGGWVRSSNAWQYDSELAERLRALRSEEAEQMRRYVDPPGCRLRYLRELLDDAGADDCGRCDRCGDGPGFVPPSPVRAAEAQALLRGADIGIEPRRQWAPGLDEPKGRLAPEVQAQWGRALARLGDGGWDPIVADLLDGTTREVPADLVQAIVGILKRWDWTARPTWVAALPSRRNATLIDAVAAEIGRLGKLPVFHPFVHDVAGAGFQSEQANSAFQLANVWGRLSIDMAGMPEAEVRRGPVLLVDDSADSRWTLTVAAHLLATSGSGAVLPFVLRAR